MADIFNLADTWNNGATTFTAIKMDVTDTASGASSLLMDLQVGGVSKFSVRKAGTFSAAKGEASAPTMSFADDDDSGLNFSATYIEFVYSGASRGIAGVDDGAAMFKLPDSGFFGWSPNVTVPSTSDLRLYRDSAGTLAQRNSTNGQTFNFYNTYTDASNYERLKVGWNANALELKPEAAGTGTTRVLHISGLPTSNPGPGIIWNNAGNVEVGT
jgi:hypothetical protein